MEEKLNNDVIKRISDISDKFFAKNTSAMAREIDVKQSTLRDIISGKVKPSFDTLYKIVVNTTLNINPDWLLTGEGEMLKSGATSAPQAKVGKGVPYYADLPVSAGELDVVVADAVPSGYVDIPGLHALALFPVVGCSMQPDINPGDVIGVEPVKDPGKADPNKVYLIITADQRMIKHLVPDEEDPGILWAISPNYPRIKIYKEEIKSIYHVTYVGRLI